MEQIEPGQTFHEKSLSKENLQPNPSVDETPGDPSVLKAETAQESALVKDDSPTVAEEPSVVEQNDILASVEASDHDNEQTRMEDDCAADNDKIGTDTLLDQTENEADAQSRLEVDCSEGTVHTLDACTSELNNQKTLLPENDISDQIQSSSKRNLAIDAQSVLVEAHSDECCAAMSRQNNVWSGATSSDPVIVREKSVKESDTCDCTMEQTTYNEKSVSVDDTPGESFVSEIDAGQDFLVSRAVAEEPSVEEESAILDSADHEKIGTETTDTLVTCAAVDVVEAESSIDTQTESEQITSDGDIKKGTDNGCEKLARKPRVYLRSAQTNSSDESAQANSSEESEDNRDDEEEEVEDDYLMRTPKRSVILDMCYELREKPEFICHQLAKECLGEERYNFLMETDPQSQFSYSDTHGLLIIFWTPPKQDRKLLSTNILRIQLEAAAGKIRDQLLHLLCWAYVGCDLISSSLVLHGWVKEYIQLCPQYLCEVVEPDNYGKNVPEGADINDEKTHSCYGFDLGAALLYVKKFGIPKAKSEKFNCNLKRPSHPDEEKYKITKVFRYDTLGEALLRLRTHTVGATLVLYEGWDRPFSIYKGPVEGAKYKGLHDVLMIDCREMEGGELAARCKSSNGETIGTEGYIYVSLEVMFTVVGSSRKSQNLCSKRPEHLLSEFYSIDMADGPLGLQFDRKRSRLMEANEYNVVEKDEKANQADGGNPTADSPSIHGKVVNNHIQKTLVEEKDVSEQIKRDEDAKRSQILSAGSSAFSLEESKSQSDIIPRDKSGVDLIKKKDISMDSRALERKAFFDRFKPDEDESYDEL